MIDFHAHIIPFIDDGAKDATEAIQMLQMIKAQGADLVVATPHFYGETMSVEDFLHKRNEAFLYLKQEAAAVTAPLPEIVLGAEVCFSYEIMEINHIDKLCIENTKSLLIEFSNDVWHEWVCDFLSYLVNEKKITPVVAHFERLLYANQNMNLLNKLIEMNVMIQINAESFLNRKTKKKIKWLINKDILCVLGSDAHNVSNRKPKLCEARDVIIKEFGAEKLEGMLSNSKSLLRAVK